MTRAAAVLAMGAGIAATIAAGHPEITKAGLEKALVHTDATYVAGGPSRTTGLATITDTNGHEVPNPVFAFDGVSGTG